MFVAIVLSVTYSKSWIIF